ncbi:FecCD family ABC transporter permease [Virgibacillus halodenitrificans]|uniref:FecCD family ABC transporter permease n=1 Tax=Virgibacillus halodenitrificans TaxID=1482 RepID=UPI002DB9D8B7|nr:iron ABC transporter permease [Virgibacillus halodenitrificans]MEC2158780.1 iron ABC transporter permease [Virgibacillus halodenitrificans]
MRRLSIRTFLQSKYIVAYTVSILFLIAAAITAISVGSVTVPVGDIVHVIAAHLFHFPVSDQVDPMYENIIFQIRLPRVLLAGLVGASLAIAGAAFQGLLRNPLADPYILGVSSGASVGAVITIFFNISLPFLGLYTLPVFSIATALLTILIVLFFARKVEKTMRVETIILTGIIFSSFLGSFISLMIALTGDQLEAIIGWLLGSVSMRGWDYVGIIIPFFVIGALLLMINSKELNAMSFGEERAQHLGVDVQKRKLVILAAGSILTGAAVAVSGAIGFVGLVIPHLTRLLWGPDHVHLLPLSIITGSGFLILTDFVSRTIISPRLLPIGVITALIGAPVFAMILIKQRKGSRGGL